MKTPLEQAAQWFMRLQQSPDDDSLQACFERWIWQDPAHATAYREVCHAWDAFDSDQALGRLASAATRASTNQAQRRRTLKHLSIGAVSILAVGGLAWQRQRPDWHGQWQTAQAAPLLGQTLPDGSVFDLGPDASLQASFRPDLRSAELPQGALILAAAADGQRPWRLRSQNVDIQLQNGRIAIDRWRPEQIRISLEHGQATATLNEPRWLGLSRIERGHWPLRAGQVLDIQAGQARYLDTPATDAYAWRDGVLVFSNASLDEIAAQLSRYAALPVRAPLGNGAIPRQPRIAASVRLTDIPQFLASLPALGNIRVRSLPDRIELLPV